MLIQALLSYFATPRIPANADRIVAELESANPRSIHWAFDAGLGPLLDRALRDKAEQLPDNLRNRLRSAELTARVQHGERLDAAADVIDLCISAGVQATLLKGISISEQHYAAGYLRPMTDIDILVSEESYPSVEALLVRRGYRHGPHTLRADAHHGVPLMHPKCRVWLELHTALFHKGSSFRGNGAFSSMQILQESVDSSLVDLPVRRLTNELQLAYIASYWTEDLCTHRIHPSFVLPLFDAVGLTAREGALDWFRMLNLLTNDTAKASVYLLLAYISERGIAQVPQPVLNRLANGRSLSGQSSVASFTH